MKSRTTARFRELYDSLPNSAKRQADKVFRLWLADRFHPSLRFKQVHATRSIYSVRVSRDWRALGVLDGDDMVWFWIGSHAEYDSLISRL
jgi:hypothetical protein